MLTRFTPNIFQTISCTTISVNLCRGRFSAHPDPNQDNRFLFKESVASDVPIGTYLNLFYRKNNSA